ncbi:MAG: hypothetical protein ACI9J3_001729 [Parvicellaceae bacterium]|jgi:hypothetical protein
MDTYKIRKPYNLVLMTLGIVLIIITLILSSFHLLVLLALPLGFSFIVTGEGWEFNRATDEFREYSFTLGYTKGKWKSSDNLNYLSVISSRMSSTAYAPANVASITYTDIFYKLILLNDSHSKKIEVFGSNQQSDVKKEGEELAKFLGVPIVKFSPPVSKGRK